MNWYSLIGAADEKAGHVRKRTSFSSKVIFSSVSSCPSRITNESAVPAMWQHYLKNGRIEDIKTWSLQENTDLMQCKHRVTILSWYLSTSISIHNGLIGSSPSKRSKGPLSSLSECSKKWAPQISAPMRGAPLSLSSSRKSSSRLCSKSMFFCSLLSTSCGSVRP